jgi:hypothetical protein
VHGVSPSDNEEDCMWASALFQPYIKDLWIDGEEGGNTGKPKWYFQPVKTILGTACMIPDLENENKAAYLRLIPRAEWGDQFEDWLNCKHTREFNEPQTH